MKNYKQRSLGRSISKQSGFAGAIFLAIALISIVIAALAYMSRGYTTGVTEQSATINGDVIIKQGVDLKDGYDLMQVRTGIAPIDITFDATSTPAVVGGIATGLFNPTAGAQYTVRPLPPASATTSTAYTYNRNIQLPGIGSGAASYVATLGNINELTCRAINHNLYNDAPNLAPAVSSGAMTDWTGTTAVNDSAMTTTLNYNLRPEGCVRAGAGFVYYKVLAEN
jgi:hypothetical protein